MATADTFNDPVMTKSGDSIGASIAKLLRPIASLKLTVALLSMSIFIVLAGTMAQVDKDIWEVVEKYFRCTIAWIPLQIFFPPSFFPSRPTIPGVIPFPGGWTIGILMFLNLAAAHGIRFKPQAKGGRLWAGGGMFGLGGLVTWIVVSSGSSSDGVQHESWISFDTLWTLLKLALTAVEIGLIWWVCQLRKETTGRNERLEALKFWGGLSLCLIQGLTTAWLWASGDDAQLSDSSMRILWQLLKGTFAGSVLLVGGLLVFKKRAGIVLIHGGIALMMVSELLVGLTAVETTMTMAEGKQSNFASDSRSFELAVVSDKSDEEETHVVVPKSRLLATLGKDNEKVSHELLPFDVRLIKFFKNADAREPKPGEENLATAGRGQFVIAEELPPGTGTDADGKVDYPATYVELTSRSGGESLGTYMLSALFTEGDSVKVGNQSYRLALRFTRYYKPYTVTLLDTRRDDYIGTEQPKNYESTIRIVDPAKGTNLEYKVWMNNPLRYAGETFYQTGHVKLGNTEISTLSIVRNDGWMIPYVACMIVVVGMLAHFIVTLLRFLERHVRAAPTATMVAEVTATGAARWVPILVVAIMALWVVSKAKTPPSNSEKFDLAALGHLPVVEGGRVKPLDTYARNLLRLVGGNETFKEEYVEGGKTKTRTQPAILWFMDSIANPDVAKNYKVIRVDNPEVLNTLGLTRRKGYRYSMAEIVDRDDEPKDMPLEKRRLGKLAGQLDAARKRGTKNMTVEERKAVEFERKFFACKALTELTGEPPQEKASPIERYQDAYGLFERHSVGGLPMVIPPTSDNDPNSKDKWDFFSVADMLEPIESQPEYRMVAKFLGMRIDEMIAPNNPNKIGPRGIKMMEAQRDWLHNRYPDVEKVDPKDRSQLDQLMKGKARPENPAIDAWRKVVGHYHAGDVAKFNKTVRDYRDSLAARTFDGTGMSKISFEHFFNHFQPFLLASMSYFFVFLIALLAWLGWARTMNRTAFALLCFTLLLHTFAMIARIYISGRPPVTNLYSSAVFIGWGVVVIGLVMESISRLGVGNVVAGAAGFSTLLIGYFLAGDGDTFKVLVAVLDTQFWLATHVTTINLGYSTTFLAGMFGVMYVALGSPPRFLYSAAALVGLSAWALPAPIAGSIESFTDITLAPELIRGCGIAIGLLGLGLTAWYSDRIAQAANSPITTERREELSRMVYGTLCFGILFSFFGTVLGGLWADDSWGRFWGWDPKENGALIIVLWNAVVLHARWGGMVKDRGLAVLSIGGNIATGWSWFGVNELGVGKHSYGFTEGVLLALGLFVLSQLVVIIIGCLPKDLAGDARKNDGLASR